MKVASKFYQLPLVVLSMLLLFWQPLSAQDETATYSVKFDALWSAESPHPDPNGTGTFPSGRVVVWLQQVLKIWPKLVVQVH